MGLVGLARLNVWGLIR